MLYPKYDLAGCSTTRNKGNQLPFPLAMCHTLLTIRGLRGLPVGWMKWACGSSWRLIWTLGQGLGTPGEGHFLDCALNAIVNNLHLKLHINLHFNFHHKVNLPISRICKPWYLPVNVLNVFVLKNFIGFFCIYFNCC